MVDSNSFAFNIRAYPVYRACISAVAWLPVFFLYFNSKLGVADVLKLEAIYFISVVVVEVPSGYISDRIGRRKTLLLACLSLVIAYICFIFAPSFLMLAVGQFFLATGIASQSGTDTALHYESLLACGRGDEYGDREARAERISFAANAGAALVGGFLGALDLRWPYVFSMATAVFALVVVFNFLDTVAGVTDIVKRTSNSFVSSFGECLRLLRSSGIAWLFVFYVFIYAVTHVPYEFYQPYLKLTYPDQGALPPSVISGCIFAATALAGSFFAGRSVRIARYIGLVKLLFGASILEMLVVFCLAMWLHPVLAFVVVLRNIPMALTDAPLRQAIVPNIDRDHRAMFLSLQSLGGRLAFALLLFIISVFVPDPEGLTAKSLSFALWFSFVVFLITIIVLFLTRNYASQFLAASEKGVETE